MKIPAINNYLPARNVRQNTSFTGSVAFVQDAVETAVDAGGKVLRDILDARPSMNVIGRVHTQAAEAKGFLEYMLDSTLCTLMQKNGGGSRPIEDIVCRVKTKPSMFKKAAGRGITGKSEIIPGLGDIIGGKIIIKTPKADEVIEKFVELATGNSRHKMKILEIENYVSGKDSYASNKVLSKLADACNIELMPAKAQKSGYTAIHLKVGLPNNVIGEIQIMGNQMAKFKDLEDIFYKINCNKVEDKYKPMAAVISTYTEDPHVKKLFDQYIKDQYAHARKLELSGKPVKEGAEFIKRPKGLPEALDFANLADEKYYLDRIAANMGPDSVKRLFDL